MTFEELAKILVDSGNPWINCGNELTGYKGIQLFKDSGDFSTEENGTCYVGTHQLRFLVEFKEKFEKHLKGKIDEIMGLPIEHLKLILEYKESLGEE